MMKEDNKKLTAVVKKMGANNNNQIQEINFQSNEIATMKHKNKQLKTEIQQLKVSWQLCGQRSHEHYTYAVPNIHTIITQWLVI